MKLTTTKNGRQAAGRKKTAQNTLNEKRLRSFPEDQATHAEQSFRHREGANQEEDDYEILPGLKPVLEMLANQPEQVDAVFIRKGRHAADVTELTDLCRQAKVRYSLLEPPAFARHYSGSSQGVVARIYKKGYINYADLLATVHEAPLPLLVALDQVQDPGNAGTFARSLYCLGGAGLVVPRHNGVYLGAAAAKTSAGALARLPVAKVTNIGSALDMARSEGFFVYGAAADISEHNRQTGEGKKDLPPVWDAFQSDFSFPALLVLGGEEKGIRPGVEKRCDALLRVPMLRDFDSLNVAQAGAILLSCFARAYRCSG